MLLALLIDVQSFTVDPPYAYLFLQSFLLCLPLALASRRQSVQLLNLAHDCLVKFVFRLKLTIRVGVHDLDFKLRKQNLSQIADEFFGIDVLFAISNLVQGLGTLDY